MLNRCFLIAVFALLAVGCGTKKYWLSPTSNVYAEGDIEPFADLAPVRQSVDMRVIYVTDRLPKTKRSGEFTGIYGTGRCTRVSFGETKLTIPDATWEEIDGVFKTKVRSRSYELKPVEVIEHGAFPAQSRVGKEDPAAWDRKTAAMNLRLRELIETRLAETPVKDVYLFVHGYSTPFLRGCSYTADFWMMMGKQGVPILFSWPAGSPGLISGYFADADSSTAAAGDLARLLHTLKDVQGLERVHLMGYSRGCDVVVKAVYDLALYYSGREPGLADEMKIENLVLLGADVDNHYLAIRFFPAYAHEMAKYMTIYTSPTDSLVGLAGWLRGGRRRVGSTVWSEFSPDRFTGLREVTRVSIVDAQVSETGSGGHGYYRTSSSCSSDLVLMIREGRRPGAENGRPLATDGKRPIWIVRDGYPNHMLDPEVEAEKRKKVKEKESAY